MADNRILQQAPIRPWMMITAAIVLIGGALIGVWFAIPSPDTRHDLVSPSGAARLELGEMCGPTGCRRVAIFERTVDGEPRRRACGVPTTGNTALFVDVIPRWSADEAALSLDYVGEAGQSGTLDFVYEACLGA